MLVANMLLGTTLTKLMTGMMQLQVNVPVLDKLIGRLQAMIDSSELQVRSFSGAGFAVLHLHCVNSLQWHSLVSLPQQLTACSHSLTAVTECDGALLPVLLPCLAFLTLQARIIISGAGDWRYLDVVHKLAGKLEALEWVRQVYNVPIAVSKSKQPAAS